jgi:hypothetical protein
MTCAIVILFHRNLRELESKITGCLLCGLCPVPCALFPVLHWVNEISVISIFLALQDILSSFSRKITE